MEPATELIDQHYKTEIERARSMLPEEKVLEGLRLHDIGCQRIEHMIRSNFPDASSEAIKVLLRQVTDYFYAAR